MRNDVLLISIIIPTYNRKELLEKAVLSVLKQEANTSFQWELIIVDDGSKDGTREYIQKYLEKYPDRVQYIYQENSWVGKARNIGIGAISTESDYLIFLDSDDEFKGDLFVSCLRKWEDLKKRRLYNTTIWLYFLCEDEKGRVIGDRNILKWKNEVAFDYMSFLRWEINFAMMQILKSSLFLKEPRLRFAEDVINETVMFVRMWQFMEANNLKILLWDYVGYVYNLNHTGSIKITKTVSEERFKKNAIWNEQVFDLIQSDLLKYGFTESYGEFLFRIGVNWILAGEKTKWLSCLKRAWKYQKNLRNTGILILSFFSRSAVLYLYKLYI